MWICLIIYLLISNFIAFCAYGWDKRKAKKGQWRISEKALLLFAVVGGSIGALIGMKVFRNKTKHLKFVIGVPMILVLQIVIIIVINHLL